MYRVARYTDDTTITIQPGRYFWKRTAQKAAQLLNAADFDRKNVFAALLRPGGMWEAWSETVLDRAIEHAKEERWQREDREARKKRQEEYIRSLDKPLFVLDDVEAGHPETVPARSVPWLDEDATGSVPAVTENDWDAANAGLLTIPTDLTMGEPAGIGCWPPLDDLPVRTPGATLTPDETLDVLDQVVFTPRYAEPEDLPVSIDAEDDLRASRELEKAFQESPIAAQVEAFLADPSAGVAVARLARKRPTRKAAAADDAV